MVGPVFPVRTVAACGQQVPEPMVRKVPEPAGNLTIPRSFDELTDNLGWARELSDLYLAETRPEKLPSATPPSGSSSAWPHDG
ncbi:hypothetical protein ASG92_25550 [Arthrobacter sp. Soil736]|uniref:hypothetical protein n=1 Tax=Arthrobacter sp. Soil736 TaxID=1736395 RepID=UPI0006FA70B3|nr:hypothetical protein [Arthrobacter sp. Soil736]KRE52412.1 hypothetical protein ASG92_25550 [Arthrobacter sp. Soil736]